MFQESALFPWLTVADNVELRAAARGVPKARAPGPGRGAPRASSTSTASATSGPTSCPAACASGSRWPAPSPRTPTSLLMDEPFGALDAMTRDLLHDELERLWASASSPSLFVTHNVREAARLGDRVVLLSSRPGPGRRGVRRRPRRVRGASTHPRSPASPATITDRLREEVRRHGRLTDHPTDTASTQRARRPRCPRARPTRTHRVPLAASGRAAVAEAGRRRHRSCSSGRSSCGAAGSRSTSCPGPARSSARSGATCTDGRVCWTPSSITLRRARHRLRARGRRSARSSALAVSRIKVLRTAVGSLITGLQTMPSIAWFPLAILLFELTESGDPVRGRPRRRAVDRQRRSSPASTTSRRCCCGRAACSAPARLPALPPRRPPGVAAVVRRPA